MEKLSLLTSKISILKFTFMHLPIYFYIIYIIIIILIIINLKRKKYYPIYLLILILFIHYNIPSFTNISYITMIDVGQGDSILIHSNKESILIDTGGKVSSNTSIAENTIIPILKSLGIKRIKYLILTHGDYDHMGESLNLIENFKVKTVIFNVGNYNYLEQELIKKLNKKKIPYYQHVEELSLNKNKLYFLNTKLYDNENDNSSVIYTNINNHKILLMGDAGVGVEEELIKKYNLKNIDILKVGHHGSKTSSSIDFINYINPKISLISVGEDNKFNHPNQEVLEVLKNTKIYRTDKEGTITIKLKE